MDPDDWKTVPLDDTDGDRDAYEPDDPKVWESYDWDLVRDMERGK